MGKESLVLIVIDVLGLDFILRTFGPEERDIVVREVGRRIQEAAECERTPYHINQDRFAVVLPDSTDMQSTRRAKALAEVVRQPFNVVGIAYQMDAFVGISQYPSHADSLNELVRTSVFACYQARGSESRYAIFDRDADERERRRFRLMIDLNGALEEKSEIQLLYQPQVDLSSGRCVGVEGLCRWHHARMGPIPPGDFLPFVEQTSLMMPLTEATLSLGLRDLAAWQCGGYEGSVAINLSAALFQRADMLERLLEQFRYANMGMEKVQFEVTESGIMEQPNRAVHCLTELRQRGSRIAVDDFGTGQSSLVYLADLPVDTIKIDKYFVQNLSKPWGRAIVGSAANLAERLGLTTVGEGIEDEYQLNQCREVGVAYGQGFHLARPMSKADFEQWLGIPSVESFQSRA